MKDQLWEEKWDGFKNESIIKELEQDQQAEAEFQKIYDWIKSHEQEVKDKMTCDEDSGAYPHDVIQTFELGMNIEGHDLYWKFEYITDRDGGEYDGDNDFTIDGKDVTNVQRGSKVPEAIWAIDQYLADLCYYWDR